VCNFRAIVKHMQYWRDCRCSRYSEGMAPVLRIPTASRTCELVVTRSRFIATAQPLDAPASVRDLVRRKREEYAGCTHVVHAFVTGEANSQVQGSSDDGEPKGTAGRPVLEVLKGSGFTNVLITVVRYYGGTNLGTGGLVRAYADSAKEVLQSLPGKPLVREVSFRITLPYPLYQRVKEFLAAHDGSLLEEKFETEIQLAGVIAESHRDTLDRLLADLSAGKVRLREP
jgi:uncharacterized YigZ family protein